MKIGINQFCFPASYDVLDAMTAAKRLGFDAIELCLTDDGSAQSVSGGVTDALDISSYQNRLLNLSSQERDFWELRNLSQALGLPISSIGGIVTFSLYPLSARDEAIAGKSMDAAKKMLDAARIVGAERVLIIPGLLTEQDDYEQTYCLVQSRLAQLCDYAPEIDLAVENVWNGMLYSPMEMKRFVDEVGKKNLGIYFDIANARRFGYPQQWIRTLGRRIKQFHCKDYRMSLDNINAFTNLLDGDVNYPEVIRAIREMGLDPTLTVELTPPAHYLVENTLSYARQTLMDLIK